VFAATGGDVSDVFVNGKHLVKDGVLTGVDLPELIQRVRKTAEKIAGKM
jgi:5-methylthioadenosine/S-adenosylhomocysteine deaminase